MDKNELLELLKNHLYIKYYGETVEQNVMN